MKLPADFVAATTTPVVAKHLNADGSVKEELKATVTKENTDFFATFYATSFSEYTLAVDNRTVTVKFGKNEAVTYTANDVGTALPTAAAETGYTFQGWSGTENATTAEYSGELTFEMLDQMIAASKNAEGVQSTLVLYPVFKKDGGSTSPGSSGGGGSSSSVSVPSASNGKVTVSNNNAKKGDTVTITLTPNTGYVVDTVTVTDSKGNTITVTKTDDTHYTFVMPEGRVTVKATFKQADAPTDGFTDVAADAYYADAVKWAVDKGITNGLTATTFGPNNSCTRGQMVTFLWRAAGSPAATGTNSFSDVASGEYYYDAVLWAVEKGITKGTSATTFSPNATVNRGQTVTFLYRYAESPAVTGDSAFTDVAADAYYADAVKWAVAEEITNGTSATTFAPASNCTRGQIVTFLYRQMAE
ncbi:MAG: S-layer homology domain-containing protein [Ruminiclostridium sp.]|nr:S-layer homology domain-containing protein [Ruminiclostridium sp.]